MGRWLLVGLSMLGFAFAFGTTSPGVLALGLLVGLGALVAALLAFAAARMEGASQAQSSREIAMILEARKLKAAAERRAGAPVVAGGGDTGAPAPMLKSRESPIDGGGPDGSSGD